MYNKNIKKKSIALATVALVAANSTCVFAQNDKKITKDEIMRAAKNLKLDTIFMLEGTL